MSDEGLVLHIGVDGAGAIKEAEKLTKEIGKKLSGVNIDFSGKGAASGIRSAIRKAGKEAEKEIKNQQRIITQVMESGVRASQAALKRVQDRQRVEASRASRGGAFDPMLPFMNPMLSGRGMSGRTRNALREYKDRIRSEQREREQIIRQQTMENARIQREQQMAADRAAKEEARNQQKYIRSQAALNRQRQREESRFAKANSRSPLSILSQGDVNSDMRTQWTRQIAERERLQKEQYNREHERSRRLASQRLRRSFAQQKEAEREAVRLEKSSQMMNRRAPLNILSQDEVSADMRATWIADLSRREREQKERYNRESQIQSRLAKDRVRRSFAQQREAEREQRRLARAMESGNRELGSMILDPYGANYTRQGLNERAAYVRDAIQKPRLASIEQARRSSYLAERARTERGFRPHGFQGPVPANFQTSRRTQAGIAEMFNKAGVYRAEDMRNQNRFGHRGNMIGMGAYQMQQMFEDYQYAGIRGMGNNLAFMGASMGGGAGMAVIGAALGLQIADLTYKMLGYAEAEEKATKRAEELAESQIRLMEISRGVAVSFANADANTRDKFSEITESDAAKSKREGRTSWIQNLISSGDMRPLDAIRRNVQMNPGKYLKYSGGLDEQLPGMEEAIRISKKDIASTQGLSQVLDAAIQAEKDYYELARQRGVEGAPADIEQQIERARRVASTTRQDLRKRVAVSAPGQSELVAGESPLYGVEGWNLTAGETSTARSLRTTVEKVQEEARQVLQDNQSKLKESKRRIMTPQGSNIVAQEVLSKMVAGDKGAFDITRGALKGIESPDFESIYGKMEAAQNRLEEATKRRRHSVEAIRDAESEADRSVRSQLSNAESMVDAAKRRVQTINEAKTKSGDTFADRAFGINRDRTADFLEKAGASKGYIQYRDDLLVQGRLSQLRGSATAAGKAGDIDRQIEMLQELQSLQLDMASRDPRHGVASGFYNASFATQGEIEAAYQKQASSALTQQQAWQGVVNSLTQAQAIKIDPMSADALPKLQQYIALLESAGQRMAGLNAGNSGVFDPALGGLRGAASGMGVQGWWNQWNANQLLWGGRGGGLGEGQQGPQPKARGGMIDGMGKNDTVNARLMPHEYVIRADVVKRLGAATFEHINRTGTLPKRMASGGMWNGRKPWWYENWNRYNSQRWEVQTETARRSDFWERIRQYPKGDKFGDGGTIYHGDEHDRIMEMYDRRARGAAKQQAYWDLFGIAPKPKMPSAASVGGATGGMGSGVGGGISGRAAAYAAKSIRKPRRKAPARRNYASYGYAGGMGGMRGWGGGFVGGGFIGGGYIGGGYIGGGYVGGNYVGSTLGDGGLDALGDYMNMGAFAVAPPLYLVDIKSETGYTYNNTPAYKRFSSPSSKWWRPNSERWGGSMRGRSQRGFHAFATGGMVQPFAPPSYGGVADILATAARGSSSGSAGRITTNNRSQIGSININVTGSGAVASTINEARRAEHAARLRRG